MKTPLISTQEKAQEFGMPAGDTNRTRVYSNLGNERGQHGPRKTQDTAGSQKATLGPSCCLQGFKSSFSWEVLFHPMSLGQDLMLLKAPPPPRSLP